MKLEARSLLVLAGVCIGAPPALATPRAVRLAGEQGHHNVGTRTLSATMTGGRVTKIQVFYPTAEACAAPTSYTITAPAGTFQISSPLCAVENAAPIAGVFPLFVWDHGGSAAGADHQRVSQLPVHERLASHGFIVAMALHSADATVRVRDLKIVLDFMLHGGHPLQASIDPDRVGVGGLSAGGGAILGFVGGVAAADPPITGDPRVKVMVLYEPGTRVATPDDTATIAVPYILMNGNQMTDALAGPTGQQALLDRTVNASPRIHVFSDGAIHFGYVTNLCPTIDEARDQALPFVDQEPLETNITTNAAASYAYAQWHIGQTQIIGFGGGRNVCTRVGIDSGLDDDLDGLTDSPPFQPGGVDPKVLFPALPSEVLVPVITHYTVAFLKVYLEGDESYLPALAPGQAKRVGPARVKIIDE
jgi:dienelactone hydrolase